MGSSLPLQVIAALAVAVGMSNSATAQSTASQVVTFQVIAVNQIAVSGNPAPLVITSAVAGRAPTSVSVSGTSYGITTNEGNKKIVASLDRGMPAGVDLAIALSAPAGAASAGPVSLQTSGVDAVTGVPVGSASGLGINYVLSATAAAGQVAADTRTVTLTIVSGS